MKLLLEFEIKNRIVKKLNIFHLFLLTTALLAGSCKNRSAPVIQGIVNPWDTVNNFSGIIIPNTGKLNIGFSYNFKGQQLVFGSQNYINLAGDTFNIEELKHYFSNFTLIKPTGERVNLMNYHLLNAQIPGTFNFTIQNVPAGNYTGITFLLGVDSLRNHSGVQEGALDPAWQMFWTWNTGYVFFRINGRTISNKTYAFDIGGIRNLPVYTFMLNSFKLKTNEPKLSFNVDINEMFEKPEMYSFKTDGYFIHDDVNSDVLKLKRNMEDMVSITKIE